MANYRKKPIVIQAVRLLPTSNSIFEVEKFIFGSEDIGNNTSVAADKFNHYVDLLIEQNGRKMKTLESGDDTQFATMGDWIIKGINGEFYPCKPDIFERTYEKV